MDSAGPPRTYRTLDALRGIAALIVVTRHAGDFFPGPLFPESFLAVDLFFLISGFVVAHAYEAKLMAGLTIRGFLRTRLVRLYPLYALGLALGLIGKLAGGGADPLWLEEATAIGLLLLPATPPLPMGSSALDGPTWTLLPELLANLAYALTIRTLRGRRLYAFIAAAAAGLIVSEAHYHSLDGGWSVERFPLIGARLAFSFWLGVAMFRHRPARRIGGSASWAAIGVAGLALVLHPTGLARQIYELVAVTVIFPAAVALAIRREPGRASAPMFHMLGVASYALYVLHQPLGALAALALRRTAFAGPSVLSALAFLATAVACALAADAVYDRPVRRWLGASTRGRSPRRASSEPQAALGRG